MLKKQKIVKLKDIKLRKIRLNLREVLMNAYFDQEAALQAIWLGSDEDNRISLLRELENFRQSYRNSILVCKICLRLDGDRVYIPRHKCWYCTDCMKKNFIPTRKSMRKLVS